MDDTFMYVVNMESLWWKITLSVLKMHIIGLCTIGVFVEIFILLDWLGRTI